MQRFKIFREKELQHFKNREEWKNKLKKILFFFTFRLILGVHGEVAAKNALLGQNSEHGQLRFLKGAVEEIARHLG